MALWSRHKAQCRGAGAIISDARGGRLPGVVPLPSGFGYEVTDEAAALAAMTKKELTQ
jgi:hypothetical protein